MIVKVRWRKPLLWARPSRAATQSLNSLSVARSKLSDGASVTPTQQASASVSVVRAPAAHVDSSVDHPKPTGQPHTSGPVPEKLPRTPCSHSSASLGDVNPPPMHASNSDEKPVPYNQLIVSCNSEPQDSQVAAKRQLHAQACSCSCRLAIPHLCRSARSTPANRRRALPGRN